MATAFEELGFKKEEIEQKVIEKIASDLMSEYVYESDTGASYPENSRLARKFLEVIKKHVDAQMDKLAQEYIVPRVGELIQASVIRHTNPHGEETRGPETFVEYLVRMANGYLMQPVDYEGKPIEHNRYSKQEQTRLLNLVDRHLHYSVETAMKEAVEQVKKALGPALEQTCKMKLGEIASSLRVTLNTK